MNKSINRKLLILILSTLVLAWIGIAGWTYFNAKHEAEEIYDASLAQTGKLLLSLVRHELEEVVDGKKETIEIDALLPPDHKYEAKLTFVIHHADGTLAMKAPNAPEFPWKQHPAGYSDVIVDQVKWRIFTLKDIETGVLVQTGQRYEVREEMVEHIVWSLLPAIFFSLPIIAYFIKCSVKKGLAPLHRVAEEITNRAPGQLDAVPQDNVPEEVQPLIAALNELFVSLERAFESEQRFTADAAHELRTPLAGIKTQAQVALRTTDAAKQREALENILIGVRRTTRLMSQLLTLARIDAEQMESWQYFDFYLLCSEVIAEQKASAADKKIDLVLEGEALNIIGYIELVRILVGNLINNAIRYTPCNGRVVVELARRRGEISLVVKDNGPGIPAELHEKIFDRFKRGQSPDVPGSGLGLAIVKRVADIHQANIEINAGLDEKGLAMSIHFNRVKGV